MPNVQLTNVPEYGYYISLVFLGQSNHRVSIHTHTRKNEISRRVQKLNFNYRFGLLDDTKTFRLEKT